MGDGTNWFARLKARISKKPSRTSNGAPQKTSMTQPVPKATLKGKGKPLGRTYEPPSEPPLAKASEPPLAKASEPPSAKPLAKPSGAAKSSLRTKLSEKVNKKAQQEELDRALEAAEREAAQREAAERAERIRRMVEENQRIAEENRRKEELNAALLSDLCKACEINDVPTVQRIVEEGVNTNGRLLDESPDTLPPLHLAAKLGHKEVVKILLMASTDVNREHGKRRAVHWAVIGGNLTIVRDLIDSGATLNEVDDLRNTPLHLAAASGKTAIADLLLQSGALPNKFNTRNYTARRTAEERGHFAIVEMINEWFKRKQGEPKAVRRHWTEDEDGYIKGSVLRWD